MERQNKILNVMRSNVRSFRAGLRRHPCSSPSDVLLNRHYCQYSEAVRTDSVNCPAMCILDLIPESSTNSINTQVRIRVSRFLRTNIHEKSTSASGSNSS